MRKTVMVTGADRGLGFALCEELLKNSGRQACTESGTTFQVIAGRYMEEWKELDALKRTYPDRLICVPLDVGEDNSVKIAAQKVMERVETVDMLIHCAGINGTIRDIRDGYDYLAMLRTLNINALGAIRVTEAFLPLMDRGTDKKICCISSEAGSIGTCWREDENRILHVQGCTQRRYGSSFKPAEKRRVRNPSLSPRMDEYLYDGNQRRTRRFESGRSGKAGPAELFQNTGTGKAGIGQL